MQATRTLYSADDKRNKIKAFPKLLENSFQIAHTGTCAHSLGLRCCTWPWLAPAKQWRLYDVVQTAAGFGI